MPSENQRRKILTVEQYGEKVKIRIDFVYYPENTDNEQYNELFAGCPAGYYLHYHPETTTKGEYLSPGGVGLLANNIPPNYIKLLFAYEEYSEIVFSGVFSGMKAIIDKIYAKYIDGELTGDFIQHIGIQDKTPAIQVII